MATLTYDLGEVNQEGLDRNLQLPASTLFRLFQSARMRLPWVGAAYEQFHDELPADPHRRLVVRSQGLSLTAAGFATSPLHRSVKTKVMLCEVGRTSLELRYTVYFDNILVARGCAVMVSVTGKPGAIHSTPVPRRVADLAPTALPSNHPLASRGDLQKALVRARNHGRDNNNSNDNDSAGHSLSFETTFVVRFSDEDANKHANHTFLIRLVEDTLACARATRGEVAALAKFFIYTKISGVAMEYMHEAHAMDIVRVRLIEQCTEKLPEIDTGNNRDKDSNQSEVEFSVEVAKIMRAKKGTVADKILARGLVHLSTPNAHFDEQESRL